MFRNALVIIVTVLLITAPVGAVAVPDSNLNGGGQDTSGTDSAASANENPDPVMQVDAPDQATVGDTFELSVWAENRGGDAGAYSTISISSPSFTSSNAGERFENPTSGLAYTTRINPGEQIYNSAGNEMTADHALVEAGTTEDGAWASGEEQTLSVEITPQETGKLVFYVRTTLSDDGDNSQKFTTPWNGDTTDQQGFQVQKIVVDVQEEPDISATIEWFDLESGTFRPGETVNAQTRVRNTGNREHTFYVGYGFTGPQGDTYSNDGSTHEPITLKPGEEGTVNLAWKVPEGAPEGEYKGETAVWRAEQDGLLEGRLAGVSAEQSVTVEQPSTNAEITAVSAPNQNQISPGDTIETSVTIENTGDLSHDFWVDASVRTPSGQWITGQGRYISLDPGQDRQVTLDVEIPEGAPEGEYYVGAAAYRSSTKDQSFGGTTNPETFQVQSIDQSPKAAFQSVDFASGNYQPGDKVTSTVTVENTGEVTHEFLVGYTAYGPEGGIYDNGGTSHRRIELSPGEVRRISLELTLPESAPQGDYKLKTALWTSETNDGLTGELETRTTDAFTVVTGQVNVDSIAISTDNPRVDEEMGVLVSLRNSGQASINDATIQISLNGQQYQQRVDLRPESTKTVEFQLIPDSPGESRLSVQVSTDAQYVEETRTLHVEGETVTVAGQVLNLEGEGISHAEVLIGNQTIETDDSGRFQVNGVPATLNSIKVRTEAGTTTKEISLNRDDRNLIEVVVGTEASLTVTDRPDSYQVGEEFAISLAVRNDGTQSSSYTLQIPNIPGLNLRGNQERTLKLAPGERKEVTVRLTPTENYEGTPVNLRLLGPLETPIATTELSLDEAKTVVAVTVLDSQGNPVEGVEVGPLQGEQHETSPNGIARFEVTPSITSESKSWQTWFAFTAKEYNKESVESVTIKPGQTNEVVFRVPASGQVQGEVVANGEGLGEVTVALAGREIRTGKDGYFEFPEGIPPGNHYIRVKKNDEVILREIVSVNAGYNNYRLNVPQERYESATGLSPYVQGVVSNALDSGTDEVKNEIYGDVDEDARVSQADKDSAFFMTDDGAYYTTGACAWYSTEESCEISGIKNTGSEESARAITEGMVTGFIFGGEETVDGVRQLLRPIKYIDQLYKVVISILKDLGLLEEMLRAVPQQIKDSQRADNPYTPGTSAHVDFASGWYAGYVTWMIAASVASSGAAGVGTKFLSSSSKFSKMMDTIKGKSDLAKKKAFRRGQEAVSKKDGSVRLSGSLDAFDSDTANKLRQLNKRGELESDTIRKLAKIKRNNRKFTDAEAEELINLYRFRYQRDLVDPNLDDDDLVHLAKESTPSEIEVVVKRNDEVYWLQKGLTKAEAADTPGKSGPVGLKHIMEKHGSEFLNKPGIDNKEDVKRVIYNTLKHGERVDDGGRIKIRWVRDDGQEFIVGPSGNGFVVTARTGGNVQAQIGISSPISPPVESTFHPDARAKTVG